MRIRRILSGLAALALSAAGLGASTLTATPAVSFRHGTRQDRLIPTRANGQPAFGRYLRDQHAPLGHAHGLIVLTLAGDRISAITGFNDNSVLARFGLPRTLPE